jgi:anaerobic magnesium-protoporphyrin IX monomethyl ester cyclase
LDKPSTNLLLIIPPFFDIESYISREVKSRAPIFTVPYGVLSLATYIKAYADTDVQIKVIDLNVKAFKICQISSNLESDINNYIADEMIQFKPQVVGISALFNTCYPYLHNISKTIKNVNNNAILVVGGGLATNLYSEILHNVPYVDAACYGEGEIPLCQLIAAEDRSTYLEASQSWVTRSSLERGRVPDTVFVQNLDRIPFFDYTLIDLNDYGGRETDNTTRKSNARNLSIHTSRGCPFKCVFCASGSVHGKKVRFMSVEKVVSEVAQMIGSLNMEVLAIDDDHFLSDRERAKQILLRLIEFNIRIEFPNGIAVYGIDEEICKLLKKAGVTTISLAVESGSEFILKHVINKPLKLGMVKKAVKLLRDNGICVHAGFVVGLPGELETHRDETMALISDIGFDWCYFNLAVPVAGSRLYNICKENNYLTTNDLGSHITMKCNIRTPDIDPEYMEEKAYLMNLEANFVHNHNMAVGNYKMASKYFQNIVEKYPDHAFAHYYLAKAHEGNGSEIEAIENHRGKFLELVKSNSLWLKYCRYFHLT